MAELQLLADALPRAPAGVGFVFLVSLFWGLRLGEACTVDAIVLDAPVPSRSELERPEDPCR